MPGAWSLGHKGAQDRGQRRRKTKGRARPCLQLASCSPFSQGGPMYQTTATGPPGGGGKWGVEVQVDRRRSKGLLVLRVMKSGSHTAVLLGLCFQVQGMHPSLVLMPTAHASLCPGSKDLADVQPYHLNSVYNIGSRFSFSNGLVY